MKNSDFLYDPVTAIDESDATGITAEIFKDIRITMSIPFITSIWRGLAGMENNLEKVWSIAKPIYQSGEPQKVLSRILNQLNFPLIDKSILSNDITTDDLINIYQIIKIYNFSNGVNLIALSALVKVDFKPINLIIKTQEKSINGKILPLMSKTQIDPKTWDIIRKVNAFGSPNGINSHVATLWRHLGYWPNFLTFVTKKFKELETIGLIDELMKKTLNLVRSKGLLLQKDSSRNHKIDIKALNTLTDYVHKKDQVIRMVVLGNLLQKWLKNYL